MRILNLLDRKSPSFERVYKVGVGIKGLDGAIELIVGLALLISPRLVHFVLGGLAQEFGEHHAHVFQFIAQYIAGVDVGLARGGLAFLILFLVTHGLVKVVLVYCLLKEIIRVYPAALAILGAFLIYQIYVLIINPSIFMAIFTILDAVIIWLVWGEYQDLRAKK